MANTRNFRRRRGLGVGLPDVVAAIESKEDSSRIPIPQTSEVESDETWHSTRPAKVARARKLAADPDYPSKEVLDSVAELLADKLDPRPKT